MIFITQNKRIISIALAIGALLSVPLIAMQFTHEVNWTVSDFVVMGTLLSSVGLLYEFAARASHDVAYRAAAGVALVAALLLIWINLAVGIIGSEDNPLNVLYFGVIALGIVGAVIARFQPRGMARVLVTMAGAQALVPVVAFSIGRPPITSVEAFMNIVAVFGLSVFFALLFVGSALLFRRAADNRTA